MEANNMAAMRKTLEEMAADLEDLASRDAIRAPAYSSIFSIYAEKCRKSLAEPMRNYEVGTAEEQTIRFNKFCLDNRTENDFGCGDCPCNSEDSKKCEFLWAQMPYTPTTSSN